jgi:hypothetical protein
METIGIGGVIAIVAGLMTAIVVGIGAEIATAIDLIQLSAIKEA